MEFNKNVTSLKFSGIANVIEKANKVGDQVIRLEVGDVDLPTSDLIKNSVSEAMMKDKTHYPPLRGDSLLLNKLSKEMTLELEKAIDIEEILITAGGSIGMYLAFATLLSAGDEVVVIDPIWPHLIEMIKSVGATPVIVSAKETENFHLDLSEIESNISSKTKAILINTPNNPTGVIYNENEIKELCKMASKFGIYIISDEEYCDYYYDNNFVSPLKFYDKVFISRSFSKKYSIAGLRLGFVVSNKELMDVVIKLSLFTTMYPSSIMQYALSNVNEEVKDFTSNARNIMNKRMEILYEGFNSIPKLSCPKSEGGLYVWLKCKDIDEDDVAFADRLLYKAFVATVPGSCFGDSGKGYLRVSLGATKEKLIEAINRISGELK